MAKAAPNIITRQMRMSLLLRLNRISNAPRSQLVSGRRPVVIAAREIDVATGEAAQRFEQGSGRRCCALFAAVDLNQSGLAAASILITGWHRMAEVLRDTVAIVDDDEAVRDSLQHLLGAFASVAEFLKAELDKVLCLIVDYHMPDMTGLDLAAWLRAEANQMPIMLVTGAPSRSLASVTCLGSLTTRQTY
jgi:hypothetical protein